MTTQKFIVSLAATTVAIAAQVLPAFAQPNNFKIAQVGPGSYSSNVNTTYTCTQNNDLVNIRSGPGKNYRTIRQINSGAYLSTYGGAQGRDGFTWRKVNYNGTVGWVRGDYLC